MRRRAAALPVVRIVSPAAAAENNGNAHTAARWQRFIEPIARCIVSLAWQGEPADLLIALHARRSADSIARFRAARADAPLALVLTGTDLYRDLDLDSSARHSLECASAIVVLQGEALGALDDAARAKARCIVQSAPALVLPPRRDGVAEFVAVGHLRDEKDPLTVMRAAPLLAPGLQVAHIGAALDSALGAAAERTMRDCAAYAWLGGLPHAAARRRIARALALVHASRMEGGANVVIEAIRSRVPVLASRIDGNVGLLGRDYEGCFEVGDSTALAALMNRFAGDAAFAARLAAQCALREPLFRPAAECAAVRSLLRDLLGARTTRR